MSYTSGRSYGSGNKNNRVPNYSANPQTPAKTQHTSNTSSKTVSNSSTGIRKTTPIKTNQIPSPGLGSGPFRPGSGTRTTPGSTSPSPNNGTTPTPGSSTIMPGITPATQQVVPNNPIFPTPGSTRTTMPGTGTSTAPRTPLTMPGTGTTPMTMPGTGATPMTPGTPQTMPGTGAVPMSPGTSGTMPGNGTAPMSPRTPQTMPGTGVTPMTPGTSRTMPGNGATPMSPRTPQTMPGTGPTNGLFPGSNLQTPPSGMTTPTTPRQNQPGSQGGSNSNLYPSGQLRTPPSNEITSPMPPLIAPTEPTLDSLSLPSQEISQSFSYDMELFANPFINLNNQMPYQMPNSYYPAYPNNSNMYMPNVNNATMGVPMFPLYGYDNCEELDKDASYMKQLYPATARIIQKEVDNECDQLEYDGSVMFDEYPDRILIDKIVDRIYEKIKDNDEDPRLQANSLYFYPEHHYRNPLRDVVSLILLNEFFHRRRRHRGRKRWF